MVSEWLGIPAAFIAWGFALYVFVVAPPTRGARFLVAMLVVGGLAVISSYQNGPYVNGFLAQVFSMAPLPFDTIHQASDWAVIAVYLPFLGMMLDSPLVAPLKWPIARGVILYGGLAIALSMFFSVGADAWAVQRTVLRRHLRWFGLGIRSCGAFLVHRNQRGKTRTRQGLYARFRCS